MTSIRYMGWIKRDKTGLFVEFPEVPFRQVRHVPFQDILEDSKRSVEEDVVKCIEKGCYPPCSNLDVIPEGNIVGKVFIDIYIWVSSEVIP